METRVLTLFDDEEFFPKEPPKEKPKKEKAAKPAGNNIPGESNAAGNEAEPVPPVTNLQDDGPVIFEAEDIPAIPVESERLVDDKVPESEAIIAYTKDEVVPFTDVTGQLDPQERLVDERAPESEVPGAEYEAAVSEDLPVGTAAENESPEIAGDIVAAGREADRELDQQMLSELIQLDYTALMQKNYAFDLDNATVINKELPKPTVTPPADTDEEQDAGEDEVFEEVAPLPEWNLDKKYYTIGEVAQLFSVNTSHIRFWTNEFKLKPRTTRKGDRLYSPKDIAELRLIHHLVKEKKHTIKGAREKLKAEKTDVHNKLGLKESLTELKNTLLRIREQL